MEKAIYQHHEEPRLKLYDPENETCPIPLKYVGVTRQTQTSTNSVPVNIISDLWTEAKGVTLSEEWTGTTRFQILRARLAEMTQVSKWKTTKKTEDYQTRQFLAFSLETIIQEAKLMRHCRLCRRKNQIASNTPQQRNLRGIDR